MQSESICPILASVEDGPSPAISEPQAESTVSSEEDQRRLRRRQVHREWVSKNKERRLAQQKRWREENREAFRNAHREWCRKNREKRRASNNKYRLAHPDRVRQSNIKQYYGNLEVRKEKAKEYNRNNKHKKKAYNFKYHQARYPKKRDHILAQTTAYAKAHPEIRIKTMAKRKGAIVGCKIVDGVISRWRNQKWFKCYYCMKRFPVSKLTIDHVVACTRGGHHSSSNIAKSCLSCNVSKSNRPITEYIAKDGQTFML